MAPYLWEEEGSFLLSLHLSSPGWPADDCSFRDLPGDGGGWAVVTCLGDLVPSGTGG